MDQDREADLRLGTLRGSARDPFGSAKALHVREPSLDRAASLTVERFALRCLHPIPHLIDQVFVRLATYRPCS